MKLPSSVSIIIPAYNEEKRLESLLFWLEPIFADNFGYEIIVACDGSTDRTREIARKWGAKPVGSVERLGKGGGTIKAVQAAKGETIITIDVDFSYPIWLIGSYGYFIVKKLDYLIGKRSGDQPFLRQLTSWLFKKYTGLLFGSLPDTQSGLKIINRELFLKVADDIEIKGYAWDVELYLKLEDLGLKIEESYFGDIGGSKVHVFWDGLRMGSDLLKLWYRRRHQK